MRINGEDKGPARPAMSVMGRGGIGAISRKQNLKASPIGRIKESGDHEHEYTEGPHGWCTCGARRGGPPRPNRIDPQANLAAEKYNIPGNY